MPFYLLTFVPDYITFSLIYHVLKISNLFPAGNYNPEKFSIQNSSESGAFSSWWLNAIFLTSSSSFRSTFDNFRLYWAHSCLRNHHVWFLQNHGMGIFAIQILCWPLGMPNSSHISGDRCFGFCLLYHQIYGRKFCLPNCLYFYSKSHSKSHEYR